MFVVFAVLSQGPNHTLCETIFRGRDKKFLFFSIVELRVTIFIFYRFSQGVFYPPSLARVGTRKTNIYARVLLTRRKASPSSSGRCQNDCHVGGIFGTHVATRRDAKKRTLSAVLPAHTMFLLEENYFHRNCDLILHTNMFYKYVITKNCFTKIVITKNMFHEKRLYFLIIKHK